MLPIPELQKKYRLQKNEGGGTFSIWNLQKKLIPEKQGGGSTLSGQVPGRNGKSVLMASLNRYIQNKI